MTYREQLDAILNDLRSNAETLGVPSDRIGVARSFTLPQASEVPTVQVYLDLSERTSSTENTRPTPYSAHAIIFCIHQAGEVEDALTNAVMLAEKVEGILMVSARQRRYLPLAKPFTVDPPYPDYVCVTFEFKAILTRSV
jgi:hypothetical protein